MPSAGFYFFQNGFVEFLQFFMYICIQLIKREKLTVPEHRHNLCFKHLHDTFCTGFVFWPDQSCRNNRCTVMFSYFVTRTVEYKFCACVFNNASLKIIRYPNARHTAKERIRMDMSFNPVVEIHCPEILLRNHTDYLEGLQQIHKQEFHNQLQHHRR